MKENEKRPEMAEGQEPSPKEADLQRPEEAAEAPPAEEAAAAFEVETPQEQAAVSAGPSQDLEEPEGPVDVMGEALGEEMRPAEPLPPTGEPEVAMEPQPEISEAEERARAAQAGGMAGKATAAMEEVKQKAGKAVSEIGEKLEKTYTEVREVRGAQVASTVQNLMRESTVRRIRVKNKNGRVILDVPVWIATVGSATAIVVAPVISAIGFLTGILANITIEIERVKEEGGPPEKTM